MKRTLTSVLAIVFAIMALCAKETAENIVRRAATTLSRNPSITAQFALKSGDYATTGSILLAGSCYRLTSPEMSVWFDGKTQWTVVKSEREINISEPTAEEIAQINPLSIINTLPTSFVSTLVSETKSSMTVRLTPKTGAGEIKTVMATFDIKTARPTRLVITPKSGAQTTIDIISIVAGKAQAKSAFKCNTKAFPKYEIVDLR